MPEEKVKLTDAGLKELSEELRNLINVVRPEVIEELKAARAQGDLSENADYDAARGRQAEVEGRIKQLENMLANVEVIKDDEKNANRVKLSSEVTILDLSDNTQQTYKIVGSVEANPLQGKISNECALAIAILDHKVNEVVQVKVKTPYEVKILSIK